MLQTVKLLLPALIPSWRFFSTIAPSPRIEFALLDANLRPVGVQLIGNEHREHRLDALTDLGVLRDDRDPGQLQSADQ